MVKSPSFFGWVGGVWAGLSKTETYEYNKVQDEESEIFVGQPRPYTDDEENVGLLAENSQDLITEKPKRRSRCCASNCSLLWKALAIVLTVAGAWYAVKLIIWAVRPAPSGLDRMPVYKTSLGCLSAPFTSKMSLSVPAGPRSDHAVDVHGGSPGTIFITEGAADSVEVQYELVFATNDEGLLSQVAMIYPTEEKVENSRVLISTPYTGETDACMRFDIVVRVPPTLKKLHVASHAVAQVQFDPEANIKLDTFFVTLYAMKENNMILPHENLHADHLMLEIYKGWIVGDVSIVNSTSIATQRGNGITNVRMHPLHQQHVEPAVLQTTTGAGRTDIFYIADHSVPHRPIRSSHVSAMNANVYLTYKHADFNGLLSVGSRSYTETGLQEINGTTTDLSEFGEEWTHWAGDKKGGDRISVKSRGWTGLYFE